MAVSHFTLSPIAVKKPKPKQNKKQTKKPKNKQKKTPQTVPDK